jgi:hypothetical protein
MTTIMQFETLEAAVVNILGLAAAGRFQVVGHKQRGVAAEEIKDSLRTVQVFYTGGKFPKSGGSHLGPMTHEVTLKIDLEVATATKGDLAALVDPTSTGPDLMAALASFREGADLANSALNELARTVFQILMDGRNLDLGMGGGNVSPHWIDGIDKTAPSPRGEYVTMGGSMDLVCRVSEVIFGDQGVTADHVLGAVLTEIETNMPDSVGADTASAGIRAGGITP